jgi:uncharacterized protein (TIGR02145 family)
MKKKTLFLGLLALWCGLSSLSAQMTIGARKQPEAFSTLELISGANRGLRLPQIATTADRDAISDLHGSNPLMQGLQIFNLETQCVETWNGTKWLESCHCVDAAITDYTPASKIATIIISGSTSLTVVPNGNPSDFNYVWKNGSGVITGTNSQTLSTTQAGSYTCTVTSKCNGTTVTSDAFTVTVVALPTQKGIGTIAGRMCYDIAATAGAGCGTIANRQVNKADFTQAATHTQVYTFKRSGTVKDVHYTIFDPDGALLPSQPLSGTLVEETMTAASVGLTLQFKTDLNSPTADPLIVGRNRSNPVTVTINIIYNNGAEYRIVSLTFKIQDCMCCGANLYGGGWREFMCYNLGADESYDPLTPNREIHGAKYKFGMQDPRITQAQDLATSGVISGWATPAPPTTGDWDMVNANPCPTGWRVPTNAEWNAVVGYAINYNAYSLVGGTWTANHTNGSTGIRFGNNLFLPAAGLRTASGAQDHRGRTGYYWTSTAVNSTSVRTMEFTSGGPAMSQYSRTVGHSIRCIAE